MQEINKKTKRRYRERR